MLGLKQAQRNAAAAWVAESLPVKVLVLVGVCEDKTRALVVAQGQVLKGVNSPCIDGYPS
jgi:hypothetical protein